MMCRPTRLALTLFLPALLAACGGGTSVRFDVSDAAAGGESIPPFARPEWVEHEGESGTDMWAQNLAALPTSGDAVVVGGFVDAVTFDAGGSQETDLLGAGAVDSFLARYATDGALVWVESIVADGWVAVGEVATTSDDEITVVGYFDGELTLAEGTSEETQYDVAGSEDAFIARYDEDGVLQWSVHVQSDDFVEILAVGDLSDDGVVVGGLFSGSITLGDGESTETTLESAGAADAFLAFYDEDGAFVRVRHSVPQSSDDLITIWSIDVSDDDIIAVVGDFYGTVDLAASGSSSEEIQSEGGSQDGYVAVYDSDADLQWVRTFGGSGGDSVYAVDISPDGGTVAVAGDFLSTATWTSDSAASEVVLTSEGETDAAVAVYDGEGALLWVRQVGGAEDDFGYDVLVNDDGEVLLVGYFTDEATFSGGGNDATLETNGTGDADGFIAGFGNQGTIAWLRTLGGTGDDYALALERVPGMNDAVYTAGWFAGSAYLWDDAAATSSRGDSDAFVSVLAP